MTGNISSTTSNSLQGQAQAALPWLKPAAILWLIFLSLNLSRLCGLHLHVDNEISALRIDPMIWLEQGRWGAFVIEKFILPHSFVCTFPLALYGVAGAFSYLLFIRAAGRDPVDLRSLDYLLFPFFIAFPSITFLYAFTANIAMQSVALLLAALCSDCFGNVLRSSKPDFGRCSLVAIWGCFCVSIYQANFLLLLAALFVPVISIVYADELKKNAPMVILKQAGLAAFLGLIAVLLYFMAQYNWLASVHRQLVYIPSLYDAEAISRAPLQTIDLSLERLVDIICGAPSIYGSGAGGAGLFRLLGLAPLAAAILIVMGLTGAGAGASIVASLWIIFWLSPVAFGPFMNIPVPVRSLVSLPLVLWFTIYTAVGALKSAPLFKAMLPAICLSLLSLFYVDCYRQSSAELTEAHDRVVITQIASRLHADVPGFSYGGSHNYKLVVSGILPFDNIYGGGADQDAEISLLQANTVTTLRVHALMRTLGLADFDLPPDGSKDRDRFKSEFAAMPAWPASGCIRVVEDRVLLKLGG